MAHINFVVPQNKSELLSENDVTYYVRNIVSIKELRTSVKLKEAKQCFKDEGAEFILENFDTYYSVLHHADALETDILMRAQEDLHGAVVNLNNVLGFLLEDRDSLNDELRIKYLNVIKMLLYVYNNIVTVIEQKAEFRKSQILPKGKGRKKNADEDSHLRCDKHAVVLALNNILQREINIFWDPPIVEESFVNMLAEVCYRFLEIPSTKSEKELRTELFNMLGTLIKSYSHGMTFVVRTVQLIKIHEHIVHCIADGIQLLVHNYNCKSLIRDFVREITEWQTEETYQDSQGTRYCSIVLTNMATMMPDLMIPEVVYLCTYLGHDSYSLRNSVLSVITEVILTVLTKPELSEEQRESRDELLCILEDHTADIAALVRSKVFQHWAKLQQENAVPVKIQENVLRKAVMHLRDKAANVRKSAANCVTTFLSHNIYGAQLHLDKLEAELIQKQQLLEQVRDKLDIDRLERLNIMKEQWLSKEDSIKSVIRNKINASEDPPTDSQMSKNCLAEMVRMYVLEDKYEEAYELCRTVGSDFQDWKDARASMDLEEQVDLFLKLIFAIFMDISEADVPGDTEGDKSAPTENDLQRLEALQNTVNYLSGATEFLKLINDAIPLMSVLLESVSIGDMQEAIQFFIAAYQFNINNAEVGVLDMLKIMQRSEEERKNLVIDAFKTIYLTTDSTSMVEHTTVIVNRLINLVQTVPFDNWPHLKSIISEWVVKGILDNSIIDMLWQYFTKKIPDISSDDSRAALHLLTMAAAGRRTIASKNIKLVAAVVFGERGQDDILLVSAGCQILTISGAEKIDVASKNLPFRIKLEEQMWHDLMDILVSNFPKLIPYYNSLMSNAIECVYALCSTPDTFCENLINTIVNSLATGMVHKNLTELDGRVIAQLLHTFGEVALKEMNFLDETVYNELKRRTQIREERKHNKKVNHVVAKNASSTRHRSKSLSTNQSVQSAPNDTATTDESTLEGASAVDSEAEYILNLVENHIVSETSGLGKLAYLIVNVCKLQDIYDDVYIQGTAITAFLRFMVISSQFCSKHLQLVFTILEKTKFPDVKCNILIHCSDILSKSPNLLDPWMPYIYARLKDPSFEVRKVAFYIIANLILRDMIRVQGRLSGMVCLIVDPEEYLREMSKNFFIALSHKANLYNMLPDIFSHLSDTPNLGEENLRFIMKFLFGLIDKNKQMENLVDRFCSKFRLTDDNFKCCNIAYCLTLIQYNEKGLRHLSESFIHYKHVLEINEVHTFFKQILSGCSKSSKNEIKDLAKEIEEKINAVFEMNEDRQAPKTPNPDKTLPPANTEKPGFKKPRGRAPKKKAKKSRKSDSDGSDEELEKENDTPTRRSGRSRQKPNKVVLEDDSDGSD